MLTRLAPIGASGAGPIPEGTVLPVDPIAEILAGRYLKVPVLAGNTRDEGKLFPSLLAVSPALGGVSGRLLTDAQVFAMAFSYDPNAAAGRRRSSSGFRPSTCRPTRRSPASPRAPSCSTSSSSAPAGTAC